MTVLADALFDLPSKSDYAIPSLAEIASQDNGLTAVSTFSGSGGSSTGLHWAGFRIPFASEFIPAARATYQANWPETLVDGRDIREVKPSDILDTIGLRPGELDLFEGSPPCSSFSSANSSKDARFGAMKLKNYSGRMQTTDDLFDEWLRMVEGIQPKAILAENVPGLMGPNSLNFYHSIHHRLTALGYNTTADIYNAAKFGAATSRRRLIISGIRRDIGPAPAKPKPNAHAYTLREALETLPKQHNDGDVAHCALGPKLGEEWATLKPGQKSTKYFQLSRAVWDLPLASTTVGGATGADPTHPDECRHFTPGELAWIFGYPADYTFTGSRLQRHERVTRSVPPPLYRAHGIAIANALKGVKR